MAASLTASVNPVGVWGPDATRNTTITWNTNSTQPARLYMTVATASAIIGGNQLIDGDPVTGSLSGSFALNVSLNMVYLLTLRQVSNNVVLETLTVHVYDAEGILTAEAAMGAALQRQFKPAQAVYDLKVNAGVDTCRVRFKTVQPTIPSVIASGPDGAVLQKWFPLFGGMRTEHEVLLGESDALPQDTEIGLKLLAAGKDSFGNTMEAVTTSAFRTGSRDVLINFQQIDVRSDGDGVINDEGEFRFVFGAGDVETETSMGEPWPSFSQDIDDDDPPVKIRELIRIERGPRKLWVQVVGLESDPGIGGIVDPYSPRFGPEGSRFESTWRYDKASVTRHFDIAGLGDEASIPMELVTGSFDVAFTVRGRINVRLKPGRSPLNFSFSEWVEGGRVTQVPEAGSMAKLSPKKFALDRDPSLDVKVEGHILAKGADGSLYRQVIEAGKPWRPDLGWMPAASAVDGVVTAVLTETDRVALFTVDRAGVALHADLRRDDQPAEWRSLGGRFTGTLAAVARKKSIELIAHDDDGAVFHRTVDGEEGADWQPVGDGTLGEPVAVALDDQSFAVFALSRRGTVLMRRNRNGRWQSKDWQVIEGATGIRLGAAAGAEGIALAVVGRDRKLALLTARDEQGLNAKAWRPQGDLQEWLTRTIEPRPVRTKAKKARTKIAA
jgi:hypothetical protein